ncbi:MAG: hypothetical protein MJ025_00065 [Victivallaceae bacterium]|nr:hypothetical protein [Victivallaceae bacterium]
MPVLGLLQLIELQKLDLRYRELKLRLSEIPDQLRVIIRKRNELEAATKAAEDQVRTAELRINELEAAISALDAENVRLRQQSTLVKKNEEYQAMMTSIENNKRKTDEIENELLAEFDALETRRLEAASAKRENDSSISALKLEYDDVVAFRESLEKETASLEADRPNHFNGIPREMLAKYERLLAGKRNRLPCAPAKGGACGNCHMQLVEQVLCDMQKRGFAECDNCQSFVYPDEE